jgi:hypothetical protein
MWRGVTVWQPYLTGQSYVRAGWLSHGKMVIYPIRNNVDGEGRQLINWVAEVETPDHARQDWNKRGRLEDFIHYFEDWHFDFLDVPAMIRAAETILEYPMVDKDPLARWSFGRVTLLGDAAHPMYPRGSNGAGQAILDARALAESLAGEKDIPAALAAYDAARVGATAEGGAHQPHDATRRDPQGGVAAHRRQAVRAHRGRDERRGDGGDHQPLQEGRRLRPAVARGEARELTVRVAGGRRAPRPPSLRAGAPERGGMGGPGWSMTPSVTASGLGKVMTGRWDILWRVGTIRGGSTSPFDPPAAEDTRRP